MQSRIGPILAWVAVALLAGSTGAQQTRLVVPPPGNPSVESTSACRVRLAWEDLSRNELGFAIERRSVGSGGFERIGVVPADTTSFVDASVASATAYAYAVRTLGPSRASRRTRSVDATTLANTAPTITTSLGPETEAFVRSEVHVSVTVSDAEGDPVSVDLSAPPPGLVFQPLRELPSPVTIELTWNVSYFWGGRRTLIFEARDCSATTRLDVDVQVEAPTTRSAIVTADVTGDGVDDLVVSAIYADTEARREVGAVYVWAGGGALTGADLAPTAELVASAPENLDRLGVIVGQGMLLGDVTGDGILDVVAGAQDASASGIFRAGAIHVWPGGALGPGSTPPAVTLTLPSPEVDDRLGQASGQGIRLLDLTGDGVLDVLAGASEADVAGVADVGSVHFWAGGAGLLSATQPTATFVVPGARTLDYLAKSTTPAFGITTSMRVAEVTGDGVADLIVNASGARNGQGDSVGYFYVWSGTSFAGTPAPTATLFVPGADWRWALGMLPGQGVFFCDVTGDGVLDVLSGSNTATVGGELNAGALYPWKGGSDLVGSKPPSATLALASPQLSDLLPYVGRAQSDSLRFADVTGDGIEDVVSASWTADRGSVRNPGAVYVWPGGSDFTGTLAPVTLRNPVGKMDDGLTVCSGNGLVIADVTGDGVVDLLAADSWADIGGVEDAGAVYLWRGGAPLGGPASPVAPSAALTVPGAVAYDQLGSIAGEPLLLGDVTGDGRVDVVVGASAAGADDEGAVYVWEGGDPLLGSGRIDPLATLHVPGALAGDRLGETSAQGLALVDVTGDGVLDVVAGASHAGLEDSGAVWVWAGGDDLEERTAPTATLLDPLGGAEYRLGDVLGHAIQFADVDGDGTTDVLVGSRNAAVDGIPGAGAILFWKGGSGLVGVPAPVRLSLIDPREGDRLDS